MTAAELKRAERNYRAAAVKAATTLALRNQAVKDALADGWTHAKIAEATGLTRGRVGQLAAGRN